MLSYTYIPFPGSSIPYGRGEDEDSASSWVTDVDLAEPFRLQPPQRVFFQVENKHRKFQPGDKELADV